MKLTKDQNLTPDQHLALAQRIVDEFSGFVIEELEYQVENMKDNDQLSYDYFINPTDSDIIKSLVVDLITVPVS